MEEKPIMVESWIRREKVLLTPFSESTNHLTYDTEITNDVVYNLTDEDVLTLLRLIKRLDKHGKIKRLNSSQTAQGL